MKRDDDEVEFLVQGKIRHIPFDGFQVFPQSGFRIQLLFQNGQHRGGQVQAGDGDTGTGERQGDAACTASNLEYIVDAGPGRVIEVERNVVRQSGARIKSYRSATLA